MERLIRYREPKLSALGTGCQTLTPRVPLDHRKCPDRVALYTISASSGVGAVAAIHYLSERLAHPRRGWKPEFKLMRYPPLDGASCSWLTLSNWFSFVSRSATSFLSFLRNVAGSTNKTTNRPTSASMMFTCPKDMKNALTARNWINANSLL